MSDPPYIAPTGSLAVTRPEDVLRFCEAARFTGTLAFQADRARGVLPMLNGAPEIAPGNQRLERALDDFLALTGGRYTLTQLLPTLEGATADGELGLRGTLESVSLADLLRYCEGSGLSGTLTLNHDEERGCIVRYERGELGSMTVHGEGNTDVSGVFAWSRGTFTIRARSVFDREKKPSGTHNQATFLRTVELALAEVIEKTDRAAAKSTAARPAPPRPSPSVLRGSTLPFGVEELRQARPNIAAPSPVVNTAVGAVTDETPSVAPPSASAVAPASAPSGKRTRPPSAAPPPPSPESTVKIYFVDKGPPPRPSGTQHVAVKLGSEVLPSLDPSATAAEGDVKESGGAGALFAPRAGAASAAKPAAKPAAPSPVRPPVTHTSVTQPAMRAVRPPETTADKREGARVSRPEAAPATSAAKPEAPKSEARKSEAEKSEAPKPEAQKSETVAPEPARRPVAPKPAAARPEPEAPTAEAREPIEPAKPAMGPIVAQPVVPRPTSRSNPMLPAIRPAEKPAAEKPAEQPAASPPAPRAEAASSIESQLGLEDKPAATSEPPARIVDEPVSEAPAQAPSSEPPNELAARERAASEPPAAEHPASEPPARERAVSERPASTLPPLDADEFDAPPISSRPAPPGEAAAEARAPAAPMSRSQLALSTAFGVGLAAVVGAAFYVLVTLVR